MRNASNTQVGLQISNNSSGTSPSDGLFLGLGTDNNAYLQTSDGNSINIASNSTGKLLIGSLGTQFFGTFSNLSSINTGSVLQVNGNSSTSGLGFIQFRNNGGTPVLCATETGKVSINLGSVGTAQLTIGAGVATSGGAPFKLTSGTNLTTPENGAFEYDGTFLYFTTGGVRYKVTLTP